MSPVYDDHPHDECGVIGIFAPNEDVARMAFFGLYALQHRGQEAAGIAVADGQSMSMYKNVGLVAQVFRPSTLDDLNGNFAIGHTRYSTTGSSSARNAQPFMIETIHGPLALAHNGNLVNAVELRRELERARGERYNAGALFYTGLYYQAAGRPVDVVRELVDNAIDAAATQIRIEVRGGRITGITGGSEAVFLAQVAAGPAEEPAGG